MGLAEPRKRRKIAHDPRNLQWSSGDSSQSFGKRLMQQQGWQQGQSLGARGSHSHDSTTELDHTRLAAAKVGVIVKDDMLGLGAQLKSRDIHHQKTGLDAFQGLLGRLNSKSEAEVKELERKEESRKLEMYARGRWGGLVFVRGGVLVQGEEFKKKADAEQRVEEARAEAEAEAKAKAIAEKTGEQTSEKVDNERKRRKEEKRRLKDEKRARKEERRVQKAAAADAHPQQEGKTKVSPSRLVSVPAPDEPKSSEDEARSIPQQPTEQPRKRRTSSINAEEAIRKQTINLKNGRHLLRGRNIEAKRKAFSDTKGLDAIFMRTR